MDREDRRNPLAAIFPAFLLRKLPTTSRYSSMATKEPEPSSSVHILIFCSISCNTEAEDDTADGH